MLFFCSDIRKLDQRYFNANLFRENQENNPCDFATSSIMSSVPSFGDIQVLMLCLLCERTNREVSIIFNFN